jgi:hypothetical protein
LRNAGAKPKWQFLEPMLGAAVGTLWAEFRLQAEEMPKKSPRAIHSLSIRF